ncbi:MAG: hypothetical protein BAJALOKI3v1_680004 [Promethearchaeota archaeon]|nr:MAG: hypothetical protein BAJALOKI3v1_680004 [Candidatus Lokiarchaeota archaeon]
MGSDVDWSKYFTYRKTMLDAIKKRLGCDKIFAMAIMPIRGSRGFRKLDYEFAENDLNVKEVMDTLEEYHFNTVGLVIKDTDGACIWNTKNGWNPTNRDILGEFSDECRARDIPLLVSFTSMNDAYQGHLHPERVSVHGKKGKKFGRVYQKGDISTHPEGEMRVSKPKNVPFARYRQKIPFLTDQIDKESGKARSTRGKGYIPLTSFMCPNSKHVDYLLSLAEEVVQNYSVDAFFADYIRYDGAFKDLCTCERCRSRFREQYGSKPKIIKSSEWYNFKEETIVRYGKKLHKTIKKKDPNCITGWFCLPGPKKWFTRKKIAQNWEKLSAVFDIVSPMEYPYLMGTRDDGWFWGKVGDFFYWYFLRNMKKRAHEFNSPALAITNSVECNAEEMLKQLYGFDFGFGIGVFKYFGTTGEQWAVLKKFAKQNYGFK